MVDQLAGSGIAGATRRIRNGSIPCAPPTKPKPPNKTCIAAFDAGTAARQAPIPASMLAPLRPYSEVDKYRVRLICTPYTGQSCSTSTVIPVWDGDMVVAAYEKAKALALAMSTLQGTDRVRSHSTVRTWIMDFAIRGASDLFAFYLRSATREPRVFKDHDWAASMSCILAEETLEAFQAYYAVATSLRKEEHYWPPYGAAMGHVASLTPAWGKFFALGDFDLDKLDWTSLTFKWVERFKDIGAAFGAAHLEEPVARLIRERGAGPCAADDLMQLWKVIQNAQAAAIDDMFRFAPPTAWEFRKELHVEFRTDWFVSMTKALRLAGRHDLAWQLTGRLGASLR